MVEALHATTPAAAQTIAEEAYIYLYPLVLLDTARKQMTNAEPGQGFLRGPMQTFVHARTYPDTTFQASLRPDFDALYSTAWVDLTQEPAIISVPDTQGRYYLLELVDMWNDAFAAPGKRTSGTAPDHFALVPQGWTGSLPAGVERIAAPTPYVLIVGRTQTNGPQDYAAVHQIQDGYRLTPLSQWGKPPVPVTATIDPTVDMQTPPAIQVKQMAGTAIFPYAAELMKLHPPHLTDWSILARMKRLGFVAGQSLPIEHLDPVVKQALERAPAAAMQTLVASAPRIARVVNGWQMLTEGVGVYGNNYLKRAWLAFVAGPSGNQPEDGIYPINLADAAGQPVTGDKRYRMHFGPGQLPPADGYWSVTLYDGEGFAVANPIQRYALGDHDPLQYNADGSLDLSIQHDSPGADKEANWLPGPAQGPVSLTMRLYAPRPEALDGRWNPPPVEPVA